MATVTTSKQFRLNIDDWWKGLIMAVLTPVFTIIVDSLNAGQLQFNWKLIGGAAIVGLLSYLTKNFFTPPAVVVKNVTDETVDAVKAGEKTVKVVNA